jgi:hypothetical protein
MGSKICPNREIINKILYSNNNLNKSHSSNKLSNNKIDWLLWIIYNTNIRTNSSLNKIIVNRIFRVNNTYNNNKITA